jgi:hypothetical protein
MTIVCPIDRLRLSKSDDTYGGVSHTIMVSEEMVHEFSCKGNQSAFVVYMMGKRELFINFFIATIQNESLSSDSQQFNKYQHN